MNNAATNTSTHNATDAETVKDYVKTAFIQSHRVKELKKVHRGYRLVEMEEVRGVRIVDDQVECFNTDTGWTHRFPAGITANDAFKAVYALKLNEAAIR